MIRFKKSMFGFGANSCVKPTKGGDKLPPPKTVFIPIAVIEIEVKIRKGEQN